MSETFESSRPTGTLLRVEPIEIFNEAHLTIVLPSREEDICIAPSDAPALALAILEAAGYQEHSKAELGSSELLASFGLTKLRQAVQARVREESEAEAQAKLEAEALELMNVRLRASGTTVHLTKATVDPVALEGWLAVARRAREMRAEK